jgi:hypothetical protein
VPVGAVEVRIGGRAIGLGFADERLDLGILRQVAGLIVPKLAEALAERDVLRASDRLARKRSRQWSRNARWISPNAASVSGLPISTPLTSAPNA